MKNIITTAMGCQIKVENV